MYNTIQINSEQDRLISELKKLLNLPTKKAVLEKALALLWHQYEESRKNQALRAASLAVRDESLRVNQEFSGFAAIHQHED